MIDSNWLGEILKMKQQNVLFVPLRSLHAANKEKTLQLIVVFDNSSRCIFAHLSMSLSISRRSAANRSSICQTVLQPVLQISSLHAALHIALEGEVEETFGSLLHLSSTRQACLFEV
jgi:hypothetical protein